MKAFKIKNGLQAGRYLLSSTTISGSTLDLSLGSMFSTTLSSDPTYTFTNPPASGVAQAFSLEVAGGTTNYVQDSFATNLYTGTGTTAQTITNGLDLATDGGMTWIKSRSNAYDHVLQNSESGITKSLFVNTSDAEDASAPYMTSYNSNGFTVAGGGWYATNETAFEYVSWTFKKQAKFFDIVTYTGTGVNGRELSHNLGSVPGCIIVKNTSTSGNDWITHHIGNGGDWWTKRLYLNQTTAVANDSNSFYTAEPTATSLFLKGTSSVNASGATYVAYLFAHDTASDSRIKCGSYTGTGADNPVTLGWAPQWLMIKRTSAAGAWEIMDTTRGMVSGQLVMLEPNTNAVEVNTATANSFGTTSTGFTVGGAGNSSNSAGQTYIYMAIRGDAGTDSAITWPTSIKWPAGVAPTTPVSGKKDLFTFLTTDGGTTYYGKKAAEGIA